MDASSPTLRALLSRRDLSLQLVGDPDEQPGGALDRPIRWVHSTDLADPTPFLSEGMVLLTTGTQFAGAASRPAVFAEYVQRLAARGVLGLGFGTEVVRDGIPPGLAAACARARMPLFEVPYRTPFIAVARANAEAIAARAYARRSWSLAAQRAISLAALRPDGLDATLAELARQLSAWVGLFDAAGALTHEHPPGSLGPAVADGIAAEVGTLLRRGARAGSSLRLEETPFTLQTLGRGGHLRGVVAIAAGDLDQEARGVVTAAIAIAGLALEQQQSLGRARGLLRAGLMRLLLSGESGLARQVARDMWGGFPAEPVVVTVLDGGWASARGGAGGLGGQDGGGQDGGGQGGGGPANAGAESSGLDAVMEWLELRAADSQGAVFHGSGDDGLVVLCSAASADAVVGDAVARFGVRAGVSAPARLEDVAAAHAQAVTALGRGRDGVTRFEEVAASGMHAALGTADARALAARLLAPVRESDARHGGGLEATLRAWLGGDARIDAAAATLGVHRHTVRARLGQAESLLGMDLSAFAVRAEVWAALVATQ